MAVARVRHAAYCDPVDRKALEMAAADVQPLVDRLRALADGQKGVAMQLRQTADGLLVIHDGDREQVSASLSQVADGLEKISEELALVEASFRVVIAQGLDAASPSA